MDAAKEISLKAAVVAPDGTFTLNINIEWHCSFILDGKDDCS